jgi:hypothetical protein
MSIEVEDFPCHDMMHPPEDRAPFCTQRANKANIVKGGPDIGPDMYFCDACFKVGSEMLDKVLAYIEKGNIDAEDMLEKIKSYGSDVDRDKN